MRAKTNPWGYGLIALVLMLATLPAARADFEEAMSLFKSKKYVEAASQFQAIVDEAPEYDYGYFMLGNSFAQSAKLKEAETAFLKAIGLAGDKFVYHLNLANLYIMQGKWSKAVGTLNTAEPLAEDKYKPMIYSKRGQAEAQLGNWEEAITDLEQAPADATNLATIGKGYFKLGDNEKAAKVLGQAAAKDPKNAEVRQLRAEATLNLAAKAGSKDQKKQLYGKALEQAQELAKLKPGTFDGSYLVGRAALGASSFDLAVKSFTTALQKKPDYCNAMVNQGKALMGKKDWANAYTSFDNATRCSPKMVQAWENKGYTLQKQEKLDEALKVYKKALELNPSSTFVQTNIQVCQQNLDIRKENEEMARLEKSQDDAARQAEDEYRKAKEKEEEWKKKQEDD